MITNIAEECVVMAMKDIIRIAIKGESGYCCAEEAYSDKVTITRYSIQYEYKPLFGSETNIARSWSYKTTSPIFQKIYEELVTVIPRVMSMNEELFVTDIGATTFVVTYADKTKEQKVYFLPGDEFKEAFSIIKQMVPGCEYVPAVLLTSYDYEE